VGPYVIVAVLLVLPVVMIMGGAVIAIILSSSLNATVAQAHEGSELLDLNR
jgi:hypothetical protein